MSQASETNRAEKPGAKGSPEIDALAQRIEALGREIGLPFIAAAADISSPTPPRDSNGRPFAETLFRWVDPDLRYWEDRGFALRAFFIQVVRVCSEPFYSSHDKLVTWRRNSALEAINADGPHELYGVGAAIIAPAYLPGGVIGAIVWATNDTEFDVAPVFEKHAAEMHALALQFVAADHDHRARHAALPPTQLTRREIQCLKWASAGKTDGEIAIIMGLSLPTVRFHMTNSARKLGVVGRAQAIYRAAMLGYVGTGPAHD